MKCDYCGRTNSDDGRGGCVSCGALLKYESPYTSRNQRYQAISAYACTAICPVGVSYTAQRRDYVSQPKPRDDDSPTFAPLLSTFSTPDTTFGTDFSGGGGDFGGGGASGDF